MLRKLMLLACLTAAANAMAQQNGPSTVKAKQKQAESKTDYMQVGAVMPALRLNVYCDTSVDTIVSEMDPQKGEATRYVVSKKNYRPDTMAATTEKHKKKKRKETEPAAKVESRKLLMTNADFDNDANLFVMMFNPTCGHCQDETEMLEKNIFYFKKSRLVLIANSIMIPYMSTFTKAMHISEYSSIVVGTDSSDFVSKLFRYQALPQINIYDSNRKLIKIYNGEVSIDSLKQYIQ